MKKKNSTVTGFSPIFGWLCAITIFLSGIIYWNKIEDATLLPRVFTCNLLLLGGGYIYFKELKEKEWKIQLIDLVFLLYVLFHYLSLFQSINLPESIYECLKMSTLFILYFTFKQILDAYPEIENRIIAGVFALVVCFSLYMFYQLTQLSQVSELEGDNLYSVNGLSGHKNLYSAFVILTTGLLIHYTYKKEGVWKYLFLPFSLFQLILVFILQTRSAFLAIIAAFLILVLSLLLIFRKGSFKILTRIAIVFFGIFLSVIFILYLNGTLTSFLNRINITNYLYSDTSIERMFLWHHSIQMIGDNWLTGVGAKNWMLHFPDYGINRMFRPQYLNMVFLQPHNDWLWVFCELGIGGFIAYLAIPFILIVYLIKKSKLVDDNRIKISLVVLICQQVAYQVFSLFDFPKERMEIQMIQVVSWALIVSITKPHHYLLTIPSKLKPITAIIACAFLILGLWFTYGKMMNDSTYKEFVELRKGYDTEKTIQVLKEADNKFSNLDPMAVPKKYYLGAIYYQMGRHEEAYKMFQIAHMEAPYNHNIINNLGGMETYFKRYDKALYYFNESLRINDRNDDTRYNISYTRALMGDFKDARKILEPVWADSNKKKSFLKFINEKEDSIKRIGVISDTSKN